MTETRRLSVRDRFFTSKQLGRTRSVTPEGFLLCEGVAIARTGVQRYKADEILLEASADGFVDVERPPEEVFRPETLASFEGKPVTVEHPSEFVTPENWNKYAVGTVQNVRRGDGIEEDLVLADLLITSADAIKYVNDQMPEISCGYDAEYEQKEPGRGVQRNIIGNHVALVDRGRAGPRVAIKDGVQSMKTWKDRAWHRLMLAIKAKDADALRLEIVDADKETGDGGEGGERQKSSDARLRDAETAIKEMRDRLDKLCDKFLKDGDPDGGDDDDDDEGKEGGSHDTIIGVEPASPTNTGKTWTGDALREILSRAEILSPGIAIPTGDALKAKDAIPAFMMKALTEAEKTDAGKSAIEPFLLGRKLSKLTGDALLGVFTGAAELARTRNNGAQKPNVQSTRDFGKPTSIGDFAKTLSEASRKNFGV